MRTVYFEGAREIKKPDSMTDEECSSAWARSIKIPAGKNEAGDDLVTNVWVEHFMPSKEDLEAMNAGRGFWIQMHSTGLVPIAVFTLDEHGNSNDL